MPASSARSAHIRRATLIGLVAVLCWSCTVGLMRSVAEALGALGGAAVLYSVSAALVLLVKGMPSRAQLSQVSRVYLMGCGLLFALYEICLSVAIGLAHDRPQSLELGMINYLWPCLTIVLAVVCRQQRARWWLWPGVALCLWGLILVMGEGDQASAAPWWHNLGAHMAANPLAYALAFGAAMMWPAYSVLARMFGGGFNGVGLFLLLTSALLWLQWLALEVPPMQWSWSVALQVLTVGAATALGYSCWEYGIQRGNLAVMAAGSYFTPVLSALLASVWLSVQPGWPFWQGVVLITGGSLVCWWATRKP
ncbi:MAG: aromatic amino acid DMT transporter YddG [Comamonas sp.]|nr:aromatic amino acid DMT transporter YddG [Comamonas sp.]